MNKRKIASSKGMFPSDSEFQIPGIQQSAPERFRITLEIISPQTSFTTISQMLAELK